MGAWVQHLNEQECWRLLARSPVGRVGVLIDSAPEIYPVNHLVYDDTIVFRTDPGAKLRGLTRSPMVCFEVDELDTANRTAWSVLVKGRAREIDPPTPLHRLAELPWDCWELGPKDHWIRIVAAEITGRRIERLEPAPPNPT